MMSRSSRWFTPATIGLALLTGCNGGGGGSASVAGTGLLLQNVRYGRKVTESGKDQIVSPLSTVSTDPLTGETIEGTLAPLDPVVNLNTLVAFGLGPNYLPRVVPRNAVLILQFDRDVDPATVFPDTLDPTTGAVTKRGSVQVRYQRQNGQPITGVPVSLTVIGNQVWVDPVVQGRLGFPPSPIDFGPSGEPRADATGYLRLTFDNKIPPRGTDGSPLAARPDALGTLGTPIGFNPGNSVLDFIAVDNLVPTNETFNGFLPDLTAPRIIRPYTFDHDLDFAKGDSSSSTTLTVATASFNVTARKGRGEWASAQLTVRPGQPDEESQTIQSNTAQVLTLSAPLQKPPADGDSIQLLRAEFYEPDPNDPIDPALFDPNNPQNGNNSKLLNFVEAHEIDDQAQRIGGALDLKQTLPAFCELSVRFNEPLTLASLGAWETFRVRENPYPGLGNPEKIARIVTNANQDEVSVQPVRDDPSTGTFEVVGWGPGIQSLMLELVTVPADSYLQNTMDGASLQAFLDQGVRSLKDLGGRPLGFPNSLYDVNDPPIIYSEPFFTDESVSSSVPPPPSPDWACIVHRFQGRPVTGIDPQTGGPGVAFRDYTDMYKPIADVNLAINGYLAGQPVVYITKIHDDFFPPPDGQFGAFPLGSSTPLSSYFASNEGSPWEHNGARFQHVYRDIDASPGRDALAGTLLDLIRVSFAPIGGNVTTDVYDDISVEAAHAFVRPKTDNNGAGASDPYFMLNDAFDYDTYWKIAKLGRSNVCNAPWVYQSPNHYDKDLVTVVPAGTSWTITQSNLYSPPFDSNAYHPWPAFTTPFQYNNGDPWFFQAQWKRVNDNSPKPKWPWSVSKRPQNGSQGDSLMLEYKIRAQKSPISRQNGFTFSPGVLLSINPYFRVWSTGLRGTVMNPDDILNDKLARCATASPGAGGGLYGDNSRYFAVFDYVKTTSSIQSPFVRALGTTNPDYFPAVIQPPVTQKPAGTKITVRYAGTNKNDGSGGSGFALNQDVADSYNYFAFKVTFVGNKQSLLAPTLDLVMIPYLRQ